MKECKEHTKVYADYVLASCPPQTPWICSVCGATGVRVDKVELGEYSYEKLINKFHGTSYDETDNVRE